MKKWNSHQIKSLLLVLTMALPGVCLAEEDAYISQFINLSKQPGSKGYTLVKTREWPESGCVIDDGKETLHPGDNTQLKVLKKKECDQAGVGYSMYKVEDTKNKNLLGYVSHRFRDGKFSLQVSVFCEGDKCVFRDLNPQQNR